MQKFRNELQVRVEQKSFLQKWTKGKMFHCKKIRIKIVSKGLVQWEIVVDILDRGAEFVKVSMLIRYQARIEKLKTAMKGLS